MSKLIKSVSYPKCIDPNEFEVTDEEQSVSLSADEIARIEGEIEALLAIPVNSPHFVKYTDRFHLRVPSVVDTTIKSAPATNVDLALRLLDDLRSLLGALFPAELPRGWEFKRQFHECQHSFTIILEKLVSGKPFLTHDIDVVDQQKVAYHGGIEQLRKSLAMIKTLRERLEDRIKDFSEARRNAILENVVFYLTQREMDLLTELAVVTQAYLAMDAARRTNVILLQNIERVMSTTVQAVTNAVFVANNVASETLNFVFDTRQIVMGFEGAKIKEMVNRFISLDQDVAKMIEQAAPSRSVEAPERPWAIKFIK